MPPPRHHGSVSLSAATFRRASTVNPAFENLTQISQDATDFESSMPFWDAIRLYRPAIWWSMLLSLAVVMEGYDLVLINSFFALDSFKSQYGDQITSTGEPTVSAPWKSALSNGAIVGETIGLLLTGIVQERIGYKKTIAGAVALLAAFIFINFFARNLSTLLAGEILCGLPWGAFQTVTTAYASEVAPVALRAYLTTYVNMCWVFGQLIATGVLRAMAVRSDEWAYRIPFALQWIWIPMIFIGALLAPESPWWLVRKGRVEDAKASLRRLTAKGEADAFVDKTIAMMEHTTELEEQITHGTSYLDLLRGCDRRRTEIVCITWLSQALCGTCFMGFAALVLRNLSISSEHAFDFQLGLFGIGIVGTFSSWFLMGSFGRRTLYLAGTGLLSLILVIIGSLGVVRDNRDARWAVGAMILVYAATYDSTIGPVCYSLVAELSSTRLKAKTIVLGRSVFNIGSIVVNILASYQFTPQAWDWGPYAGYFWAGTNTACLVWMFFRLPEPKGRTYGELDILFENKVPARAFAATGVDIHKKQPISPSPAGTGDEGLSKSELKKRPNFRTVEYSTR